MSNKDGSWEWTGSEWKELPTIKQRENTMSENWSQGNLLQQVGYGFADGIYSMFADKHLNGYAFESYDDKMTTKTMGLLTFLGPIMSEANAGIKIGEASTKIKYIGRLEDLKNIPRSQTLLDDLPNLGNPKANYYQNMSVLRKAIRDGYQIKDASWFRLNSELAPTITNPNRTVGQTFLGAERLLLKNKQLLK